MQYRAFQAHVGLVDLAVAALADRALHLALKGDPDLVFRHAELEAAKGREVHEMYKKYVEEEKTEKTDDSKTENQNTDKTQQ